MSHPKTYHFLPVAGIFLRWSRRDTIREIFSPQKKEAHKLFEGIRKETDKEYRAIGNNNFGRMEARSKMIEIYLSYCAKFDNLLNETQKEKLKQRRWRAWDRKDREDLPPERQVMKICA